MRKLSFLLSLIASAEVFAGPVGFIDDSRGVGQEVNAAVMAVTEVEQKAKPTDKDKTKVKMVQYAVCKTTTELTRQCIEPGLSAPQKTLTQFDTEFTALMGLQQYKQMQAQKKNLEQNIALWRTQIESNTQSGLTANNTTLQNNINTTQKQVDAINTAITKIQTDKTSPLFLAYTDYNAVMSSINADDDGSEDKVDKTLFRSQFKLAYDNVSLLYNNWKLKNLCYCGSHYAMKQGGVDGYVCAVGKGGKVLSYTKTDKAANCQKREFCQTASWSRTVENAAQPVELATVLKESCGGHFEMGDMQDPRLIKPLVIPGVTEVPPAQITSEEVKNGLDAQFENKVSCSFKPMITKDKKTLFEGEVVAAQGTSARLAIQRACGDCIGKLKTERNKLEKKGTFFFNEKCYIQPSGCTADGNLPLTLDTRTLAVAFQDNRTEGATQYCFIEK